MQSTLILSKSDGSIIRSTGLLATSAILPQEPEDTISTGNQYNKSRDLIASQDGSQPRVQNIRSNTAEEVAKIVFTFVTAANGFAEGIDSTDAVKLLRMRTRKYEIVIVPGRLQTISLEIVRPKGWLTGNADPKFLLVVLHDTPPA